MKVIKNTLEILKDRWDDPGGYPNALAAGPLLSYDYYTTDGELVVELDEKELADYHACVGTDYDAEEWVNECLAAHLSFPHAEIRGWQIDLVGNRLSIYDAGDAEIEVEEMTYEDWCDA